MFTKDELEILDKTLKVSEIKKLPRYVRYLGSPDNIWVGYSDGEIILNSLVVYSALTSSSGKYIFKKCKPCLIPMDKVYSW